MSQTETVGDVVPISSKPTFSFIYVTPEMAQRWLARMPRNRSLREADVRSYSRDMAAGNWHDTGESIKFDAENNLLDGQHRLHAVIHSGVTLPVLVVRGLPPESQMVMDTGRKRTASDALQLAGNANSSLLASVAKLALGVEAGIKDPGKYGATHSEIADFIAATPGIHYACDFGRSIARRTDCPPSVVAYTFFVLGQIDLYEAANFWTAAAEKVGLRSGDPVIALTNRFAEARRNREVLSKRIYLSLIYRAWNTRREGKSMRFMRVNSPAGGLVPIPEPR